MEHNKLRYSLEMMAHTLHVSVRSYYDYVNKLHIKRAMKRDGLCSEIQRSYAAAKGRYGSPRLAAELRSRGIAICAATTAKYMAQMGLRCRLSKRYRVTTDSKHASKVASNLLDRQFSPSTPGSTWVSDITYIYTLNGFIYLTTVIDLFDRRVVGWSISDDMTTQNTVVRALKMALHNRPINKGALLHSDRGVQYASTEFRTLLRVSHITQSMSRKGNCWDNAVAESFFKSLKWEMIYGNKLVTADMMRTQLFEYIEVWYNKSRRHSALGNLTLDEFWNQIIINNIQIAA